MFLLFLIPHSCFLSQLGVFLTAFLVPVLLILIFNLIVYIFVLHAFILHTWRKNKRQGKTGLTPLEAIKMLLSFTGIIVLFGLTWVFAAFTFISEPGVSYTVQFLFAFFNVFQGFYIFIFFVVLSSDSRAAWKSLLCPWLNKKEQTSKYNLASSKKVPKDSTLNSSSSNTYESKTDTLNEKAVLAKMSGNSDEYSTPLHSLPPLVEEDDQPAPAPKGERKDDLDLVNCEGVRVTRHSTLKHTHHIEHAELDLFVSDDDKNEM